MERDFTFELYHVKANEMSVLVLMNRVFNCLFKTVVILVNLLTEKCTNHNYLK